MNMQVIIDPVDGFSLLAGGQCPLPPATAGGYRVYVSIATQLRASRTVLQNKTQGAPPDGGGCRAVASLVIQSRAPRTVSQNKT